MANGIYQPSPLEGPLRQGEILCNVSQLSLIIDTIESSEKKFANESHTYAIVVSQDCDLDLDHQARNGTVAPDKQLPNILFCRVTTAEILRGSGGVDSGIWKRVKINKDERYHFLQKVDPVEDALGEGLPELGIDFKRYFTIPTEEIYLRLKRAETQRRCCLLSPYLEHLSTRFAYYQFRVALPSDHVSD